MSANILNVLQNKFGVLQGLYRQSKTPLPFGRGVSFCVNLCRIYAFAVASAAGAAFVAGAVGAGVFGFVAVFSS